MRHWRYRTDRIVRVFAPELVGIGFMNDWITIYGGTLTIKAGYAWDGCSPSFPLLGGVWMGPWDGPRLTNGRPVTWRASLVHDALCQFRHEIPELCKEATVALFKRLLQADGAPAWMVTTYTAAIDLLGPQDFNERSAYVS